MPRASLDDLPVGKSHSTVSGHVGIADVRVAVQECDWPTVLHSAKPVHSPSRASRVRSRRKTGTASPAISTPARATSSIPKVSAARRTYSTGRCNRVLRAISGASQNRLCQRAMPASRSSISPRDTGRRAVTNSAPLGTLMSSMTTIERHECGRRLRNSRAAPRSRGGGGSRGRTSVHRPGCR